MRGHGAAKMRHTYTPVWRSTATFLFGGYATLDDLQVHMFIRVQFIVPFRVVEAGQDWTCVADQRQDRRSYKAQLPTSDLEYK